MINRNNTGRSLSIPSGLALGAAVSIIVTVAISFIGAQLVMNEMMPQEQIGYCAMAALLAATVLGAITASSKIKRRKLLICILSGCIYFCILLASTALFFGGQYTGFGVTFLTVLLGCGSAAVLSNGRGERRFKHKHKKMIYNCTKLTIQ